jgi:hypothetical protein
MKKTIILVSLFSFMQAAAFADAPRGDITVLERVVTLANPEAFPDYLVLAYVTGPQLSGLKPYNVYEIKADTPIDNFSSNNEVAVIAVKRSTVKSLGLDAIDFARLVATNKLIPAKIAGPFQTGTYEASPPPYREEIVYALTALCNESVFLQPAMKTLRYTDGRVVVKTYIERPAPRRYTRLATAESVSATDFLTDNEFPDRYHLARAFDGVPETGWSEGADGSGVGKTVSITFTKPVTVDRIAVIPGWFDARFFRMNNRVRSMAIQSDTFKTTTSFADSMTAQNVSFTGLGKGPFTFTTITFMITDVYRGTDWDDTPIAEIQFFMNGEQIYIDLSRIEFRDSCYEAVGR